MPSGRIHTAVLLANTNTLMGVCPAGKTGSFNLTLLNNTAGEAKFKIAVIDGDLTDIAIDDYIEDTSNAGGDSIAPNGGVFKLTGEPIGGAVKETIMVWSDSTLVVRCTGFFGNPVYGEE